MKVIKCKYCDKGNSGFNFCSGNCGNNNNKIELSPKEKAIELLNKIGSKNQEDYCTEVFEASIKQCKILCDEILNDLYPKKSYWEEVKYELNLISK